MPEPSRIEDTCLRAALGYLTRGLVGRASWSSAAKAAHRALANLRGATSDRARGARRFKRWPLANVAIVTGAISGIVILDVDPSHSGEELLMRLALKNAGPPETVEAATAASLGVVLRPFGTRNKPWTITNFAFQLVDRCHGSSAHFFHRHRRFHRLLRLSESFVKQERTSRCRPAMPLHRRARVTVTMSPDRTSAEWCPSLSNSPAQLSQPSGPPAPCAEPATPRPSGGRR